MDQAEGEEGSQQPFQAAAPGTFTAAEARGLRQLFGQGPAGAQNLLDQLARGPIALPPGVTLRTLQNYATIARAAITGGIDKIGTQALRLEAIQHLLGQ